MADEKQSKMVLIVVALVVAYFVFFRKSTSTAVRAVPPAQKVNPAAMPSVSQALTAAAIANAPAAAKALGNFLSSSTSSSDDDSAASSDDMPSDDDDDDD